MMVDTLKKCIADPECTTIKIATGYWDIPGMTLVFDELKSFLERDGTSVQLLIGSDPIVRAYQLQHPRTHDARFPQDFIRRDIGELQVAEEYVAVVKLLIRYCTDDKESPNFIFGSTDRTRREMPASFMLNVTYSEVSIKASALSAAAISRNKGWKAMPS